MEKTYSIISDTQNNLERNSSETGLSVILLTLLKFLIDVLFFCNTITYSFVPFGFYHTKWRMCTQRVSKSG